MCFLRPFWSFFESKDFQKIILIFKLILLLYNLFSIRMNFLNHLETWLIEGKTRSNAIVVAKSDEIEKELELRLHLHEPRMKRAEMDVHNVRAC